MTSALSHSDDYPLGIHVQIHVHDLPRSRYPKNLLVKFGALHREELAGFKSPCKNFHRNSRKAQKRHRYSSPKY